MQGRESGVRPAGTLSGSREERLQHPRWKASGNLTEILGSAMTAVEDKAAKQTAP